MISERCRASACAGQFTDPGFAVAAQEPRSNSLITFNWLSRNSTM
jgi:hypothetical protein